MFILGPILACFWSILVNLDPLWSVLGQCNAGVRFGSDNVWISVNFSHFWVNIDNLSPNLIIFVYSIMPNNWGWATSTACRPHPRRPPATIMKITINLISKLQAWHASIRICNPYRIQDLPTKSTMTNYWIWWNELVTTLYKRMDRESTEDRRQDGPDLRHAKEPRSLSEKFRETCLNGI